MPTGDILDRYKLARSTVKQILNYDKPERARITRTGRPKKLSDHQADEIIEYCSESWEHRVLNYTLLHNELKLECLVKTLKRRLEQRVRNSYLSFLRL